MLKLYQVTDKKIIRLNINYDYYIVNNVITFNDGKKISISDINQILINGNLGLVIFSDKIIKALIMKIMLKKLWKKMINKYKKTI